MSATEAYNFMVTDGRRDARERALKDEVTRAGLDTTRQNQQRMRGTIADEETNRRRAAEAEASDKRMAEEDAQFGQPPTVPAVEPAPTGAMAGRSESAAPAAVAPSAPLKMSPAMLVKRAKEFRARGDHKAADALLSQATQASELEQDNASIAQATKLVRDPKTVQKMMAMLNKDPRVTVGTDGKGRFAITAQNAEGVAGMPDHLSEADMIKKFRVGLALQPIATAMFACSPFREGRPNGFLSYRAHVWTDVDNARSGMLPWVFEDGMSFERYVDYALDVPMYFIYRDGKYHDVAGKSFRDFLAHKLPGFEMIDPTLADWADHLTTIFPEVRLKKFLEMRGADGGLWRRICALPALWTGIYYDQSSLDAAWDLVKDWTAEERSALREAVPKLGLNTPFRNTNVKAIARHMLDLSRNGLRLRAQTDSVGGTEEGFIEPLFQIVGNGKTRAEELLERYEGPWQRDLSKIFAEYSY